MPVIINFKVCDNAEACNAINVCPTGAFRWNKEKNSLEIDESTCINCGKCATSEESCGVGAIKFAKDEEELKKIKKEIDDDPRTISDLMVDRYGGQPLNNPFYCQEDELQPVLTTPNVCFVEFFNDDSIECLIKSIPIKEILKINNENNTYRKVEITTDKLLNKYGVKSLPALLIIKNDNLLGKIEGYYSIEQKQELMDKINEILNK